MLSCKHNLRRAQRHHYINDLLQLSMTKVDIPVVKKLHGIGRLNGKQLDGLTSIPWREGRSATWDVTVTDTTAACHVVTSHAGAPSAAEAAAQCQ
jgi:hypothetical protein